MNALAEAKRLTGPDAHQAASNAEWRALVGALVAMIAHKDAALTIAKLAIEQCLTLDARTAANGPTIGEVIEKAQC